MFPPLRPAPSVDIFDEVGRAREREELFVGALRGRGGGGEWRGADGSTVGERRV